jgi:RYK receptor-like tyrosine kinase
VFLLFFFSIFFRIDDQLRVKLADNSLSRDLFPGDYYCLGDSENRPIKWLALEALQRKHFSEASDTWAFGVLMWELCTLARQPYAEVSWDCMEKMLNSKVYVCFLPFSG